MDLLCLACKQIYQVENTKKLIEQPPGLQLENRSGKLRLSWWRHGLGQDIRWLGVVLLAIVLAGFGFLFALAISSRAEVAVWGFLLTALPIAFVMAWGIFRTCIQRQVIEADSLAVQAWNEPLGGARARLDTRQVQQLYVTKNGELRCQSSPRQHLVLLSGPQLCLHFAEQQVEKHLNVQDTSMAGEWRPPNWVRDEWRVCPHCQHQMPAKEVARQAEPVAQPARVKVERPGERLEISWSWRTAPQLVGILLWVVIWDLAMAGFMIPVCAAVLSGRLEAALFFLMPHVWVAVFMTYYAITLLVNRTVVTCDSRELRFDYGPLPWRGAHRQFAASDLKQLYVTMQRQKNSTTFSLEANLKSGQSVKLLGNEGKDRLDFVEQEIERYFVIADDEP